MMFSKRNIDLSTFYWLIFGLLFILIMLVAPFTLNTTRETSIVVIKAIASVISVLFVGAPLIGQFARESPQD